MNETELLFTHVLKCDRAGLYAQRGRALTPVESAFIADALQRRVNGEPLQYILGKADFMGMEFTVDKRVLIPRPETEILVETAIRYAGTGKKDCVIIDVGTGCGNIAVAIAKSLPSASVTAIDISPEALALAAENAAANGVGGKINFALGDMLADCRIPDAACSVIVSNPPYVLSHDVGRLQPEVRHEPRVALDGGKDGLIYYRSLAVQAPRLLAPGGMLVLEMGFGLCDQVREVLEARGEFTVQEVINDYCGIERIIAARKN